MSDSCAQICSSRSPSQDADCSESFGNGSADIVVSFAGLFEASPKRWSKSEAPTDIVTVSPSGSTTGPTTPLSYGRRGDPRFDRRSAGGQEADLFGDRAEEFDQLGAARGGDVERDEGGRALRRGEHPAWWRPSNG